jgi:hypothetical protein
MDGLAPGDSGQVYTVMVTSSDGLATKSYSVVVRKAKTHPVGITIGALEGPTVPFTFSPGVSTYNVVLNTFNTNVMINVTKLDDQFVKINGSEAGGINMFFPGSGTQSATIETTHWLYSGTCTITITKP